MNKWISILQFFIKFILTIKLLFDKDIRNNKI